MKNIYYVYAYLRKSDLSPYYIGKGKGRRIFKEHNVQIPADPSKTIFLHQNCEEKQAYAFEIFWIAVYGRKNIGTGRLLNRTPGGEGGNRTGAVLKQESKDKIRDSNNKPKAKAARLLGASNGGKWHTGKPKAKYECPHCKRMIASNMFNRYHNNNCKLKDS